MSEHTLLGLYQDHISDLVKEFTGESSVTEAAEDLGVARSSLREWKEKESIPAWKSYYHLNMETNGYEWDDHKLEQMVEKLSGFLALSLDTYFTCTGHNARVLSDRVGINDGSIRTYAKGKLPRAKQFFSVLDEVYAVKTAKEEALRSITDIEILQKEAYENALELIHTRNRDDEKIIALDSLLPIKKTASEQGANVLDILESYHADDESSQEVVPVASGLLEKIMEINEILQTDEEARLLFQQATHKNKKTLGLGLLVLRQVLRGEEEYQTFLDRNPMYRRSK